MRLFKRPSASPLLVSATAIPLDGAVINRINNDDVQTDEEAPAEPETRSPNANGEAHFPPEITVPAVPSSFSARKGISTWGKKVGRRWDQLKRSDSSELLSVSGRRRRWSPNRKSLCECDEVQDKAHLETPSSSGLPKPKRISRVESLRNLFRANERGSSNAISGEMSTRGVTIEEEEDVTCMSHYTMDKAFSDGELRNMAHFRLESEYQAKTLHEKKEQLTESITNFQEQQRVFDYILKNRKILKTEIGMYLARESLAKTYTNVRNDDNRMEDKSTGDIVELNAQAGDGSKTCGVKRNLFGVSTSSGESERSEQRRSFIGSGLEDLMCSLRLGCDESGYDSDSTRAGADSPDSEKAIRAVSKPRCFSRTFDDYQGIDLSSPVSTPKKMDTTTGTIERVVRSSIYNNNKNNCSGNQNISDSNDNKNQGNNSYNHDDIANNPFNESVRTDTTAMSEDDDTDSCDEDTFEGFSNLQFTPCFVRRTNVDINNSSPVIDSRNQCLNNINFTSTGKNDEYIGSNDIHRAPVKHVQTRNEEIIPLGQVVRLQNLQRDTRMQVTLKGRKASNSSILNLVENATSPCKDSPPATQFSSPALDHVQYYSPKRSCSNMESDGADTTEINPVKRPILTTPLAIPASTSANKTLIRRELKTMKLQVERPGNLGILIEKREAVRPFYVVTRLDGNGEAAKLKQIRVGDEIVRVCGRRLRGMSTSEARNVLKSSVGTVMLQIAREPTFNFDGELGDTWGEPISRTTNDSEVWTLNMAAMKVPEENSNCFHQISQEPTNYCEIVGTVTKRRKSVSMHATNVARQENETSKLTGMRKFHVMRKRNSMPAVRSRRTTSLTMDLLTITLEKGAAKKLGFSIVGGSDSNKGSMGIFVKDVMIGGQAAEEGTLRAGDEVLAINGQLMEGLTHAKALQFFKAAKPGKLIMHVGRRDPTHKRFLGQSRSYDCLDKLTEYTKQ